MIPFRRFSVFISRILTTVILISTALFGIFGLTKYMVISDGQHYAPVGSHLLKNHHHHDHHNADRRVN